MAPPTNTGSVAIDRDHHRVAVIRVEVRDRPPGGLLIELVEVGQAPGSDRRLGSATTTSELCRLIEQWLRELTVDRPTAENP
jgi:hypothetical protein